MTPDQVELFISSRGFKADVASDLFHNLGEELDRRLDACETFTCEQAGKFFNLSFEVFRVLFAHYLASLKIQDESGTRH